MRSVTHVAGRRLEQCAGDREECGLPRPVRTEHRDDFAGAADEGHAGQGPAPAEGAGDVGKRQGIEAQVQDATPTAASSSSATYTCSSAVTSSPRRAA